MLATLGRRPRNAFKFKADLEAVVTTAEQMEQARKVSYDALTAFYEAAKRLGTAQMESSAAALAYSRALKAEAEVAKAASRGIVIQPTPNHEQGA